MGSDGDGSGLREAGEAWTGVVYSPGELFVDGVRGWEGGKRASGDGVAVGSGLNDETGRAPG